MSNLKRNRDNETLSPSRNKKPQGDRKRVFKKPVKNHSADILAGLHVNFETHIRNLFSQHNVKNNLLIDDIIQTSHMFTESVVQHRWNERYQELVMAFDDHYHSAHLPPTTEPSYIM